MDYLDFELEIGPGEGRDYPVAVVGSPAGAARGTMRFPFDDLALESRLKDLQIALLRSGGSRRRVPSQQERAVQDFGQALFQAALSGPIRERYDASLREARRAGKGLRLKLEIRPPRLAALPWEFLYDPDQAEYLCLCSDTPIVRYLDLPRSLQPLSISPPLRILGLAASPADLPPLSIGREKQRVGESLQELASAGLVDLTWLDGATWRHLMRAVRRGPWHVFYFMGHGGFDRVADEGYIALADDYGETHRLTATQLGRVLADHPSLQLAALNSCEGGTGSRHDVFSSTAAILVRRGVPAVLAMQYEITDHAAVEFTRTFFESLADGFPVDASVTEARKAISLAVNNTVEWGTPVLYVRSSGSVLFSLAPGETPAPADRPPEPPPEPARPRRRPPQKGPPQMIGIDLGVANATLAVYRDGRPQIIPNRDGETATPSAVACDSPSGELVAGTPARRLSARDNPVFRVMRFVGCDLDDPRVQEAARSDRCELRPGPDRDVAAQLGNRWVSATEALAALLTSLKQDAEAHLDAPVGEAVIAVPTLFDHVQRQAIIQAARTAGIQAWRVMSAPAAMLLGNEWLNPAPESQDLVACHVGAGATGIAVANVGDRVCAVEAYQGDAWLGGDNFDRCIVAWLVREFQEREDIDLLRDPRAMDRLREAAESARIELSARQQAEIYLPHIAAGSDFPMDLSRTLTRPQFEELARDPLETFRERCRQVLQDRWDRTAIDGVILGGGATRMPMIQEAVSDVFGSPPWQRADPGQIVALGAAVRAAILKGQEKGLLLMDATALTLSVETLGGVATPLIPCNSSIPARTAQVFSTAADNQSQVEINVIQGQGEKAADNRSLGKFILDGIPPAPKGVPQIEVTFDIDADSILHVSAREKTTGKEMSVRI